MAANRVRNHSASHPTYELVTILDLVRFATSRFVKTGIVLGHGTSDPVSEAMFLVCEALRLPIDRAEFFLLARLTMEERRALYDLIQARVQTRRPSAYMVNRAYIRQVSFFVDERVIIPRSFIGELLGDEILMGEEFSLIPDPLAITTILDLCTGSGCLAILAAHLFVNATVDAVDLSGDALEVAKINVSDHGLSDRICLLQGNLFEPIGDRRYDLILANPPYVDSHAMARLPPEYSYEPVLALDGGKDGLAVIRPIVDSVKNHLTGVGGLLCEAGRTREALEREYPSIAFTWLDTEESSGEVFWLNSYASSR